MSDLKTDHKFQLVIVATVYLTALVLAMICSGTQLSTFTGGRHHSSDIGGGSSSTSRKNGSSVRIAVSGNSGGSSLGWTFIGSSKGVATFIRKESGSKLLAFKGAAIFEEHISQVLAVFSDVHSTAQWVDMLKEMRSFPLLPRASATAAVFNGQGGGFNLQTNPLLDAKNNMLKKTNRVEDIVYQYYQLPWPLSNRDFVFHRVFEIQERDRLVTANYSSVEDPRLPAATLHPTSIRAESPFTNWRFQSAAEFCKSVIISAAKSNKRQQQLQQQQRDGSGAQSQEGDVVDARRLFGDACLQDSAQLQRSTYIEIESLVDNKGTIPAWFINYMQRYQSILSLLALLT